MRNLRKLGSFLLLLAASAAPVSPLSAYVLSGNHWTYNRTVTINLSLGGGVYLQDGFASYDASAADALNAWNQYLAHMQFASIQGSPLSPADGDSDNSAFFSNTVYGSSFGRNVLAVTLTTTRGSITTETDVLFNNAIAWNSYHGPLQGSVEDLHRVALHEFGHVVGLKHPDDSGQRVTAIMNSTVSNIETLQTDDINGAQAIYNSGPPYLASYPSANLVNLSTRAYIGTGDNVLIGGFIVQGAQPATVILRGIGHSLGARGVSNALGDPQMELRDASGNVLAQNDDWIDSADATTIAGYRLDPPNSTEAAILRSLNAGNYTVIVKAYDNGDGMLEGTGLFELYDLHTSGGRAGNISSRGQVLSGNDILIAGFIIGGSAPKEVVVRALGPSLADARVTGALADPTIEVRNSSGQLVASNDNWQTDAKAARVQSLGLAPARSNEAAIDLTLNPGTYTAIMRGAGSATGIGLVEIYDVTPAP